MTSSITSETVRSDFNDPVAVVHYTRAAHFLGLWRSEQMLVERFFPEKSASLIEAGCGAGRGMVGLWDLGYRKLTAFDFAEELLEQARDLSRQRGITRIRLFHADVTRLDEHIQVRAKVATKAATAAQTSGSRRSSSSRGQPKTAARVISVAKPFDGALFLFNGLMQIPGRENRRTALRQLAKLCRNGAPILFTTHDRNVSARERQAWSVEAERWRTGRQDPRLVEFGDRYFEDRAGRTFMHLPDREEILADLASTGWIHTFDSLRRQLCAESREVQNFSDECRFWVAHRGK